MRFSAHHRSSATARQPCRDRADSSNRQRRSAVDEECRARRARAATDERSADSYESLGATRDQQPRTGCPFFLIATATSRPRTPRPPAPDQPRFLSSTRRLPLSTVLRPTMAAPEAGGNTLKEASLETLRGILSSRQDVRKAAERQVKALEVTEGSSRTAKSISNLNVVVGVWW